MRRVGSPGGTHSRLAECYVDHRLLIDFQDSIIEYDDKSSLTTLILNVQEQLWPFCAGGEHGINKVCQFLQQVTSITLNYKAYIAVPKQAENGTSLKQNGNAKTATPMMLFARLKTNGQLDEE